MKRRIVITGMGVVSPVGNDLTTAWEALVRHLSNRVEWLKSVRYMVERGTSTFVEIGAGQVVNGLVKRIADVKLVNVTDNASIAKAIQALHARTSPAQA